MRKARHARGSLSRAYDIAVTKPAPAPLLQLCCPAATRLQHGGCIVAGLTTLSHLSFRSLHRWAWPCAAALLWALCGQAQADVYAFVDAAGTTHFSDNPSDARYQLVLRVAPDTDAQTLDGNASKLSQAASATTPHAYAQEVADAAQSSQVEAALLHAVIAVESNYNPRAVSRKGAQGLMQLMPATARAMGVRDPLNAMQNIRGGAQYLRLLLDRFANNKSLALAAYNAGAGAVLAYGGQIPPFAETRSYVPAVLLRYQQNVAMGQ